MKKFILFLFIAFIYVAPVQTSYAQDKKDIYEVKIIEKLVLDITKKNMPKVFAVLDENKLKIYSKLFNRVKIVDSLHKADFVLLQKNTDDLEKVIRGIVKDKIPALVLDLHLIRYCPDCLGIFSWINGRPNLILFEEVIRKLNIRLPKEYDYFIESKNYLSLK